MISKTKMLMLASAVLLTSTFHAVAEEKKPVLPDLNATQQADKNDPKEVYATVNGKALTAGELDAFAQSVNPDLMQLPAKQRHLVTLRIYLDSAALTDAAVKNGLDKGKEFDALMTQARSSVLQRLYFQTQIVDKISDADIKARYDELIKSIPQEDEVHARHILVATKEEAAKIIAELDKGASFEELAKKSSTDGSAAMGGDLGYFTKAQMVKPFADAAFALKTGTYSKEPVESPFGWHVIKVEDRRGKELPALAEVKEELRSHMARERYQQVVTDLRDKMNIKYASDAIAKAMSAPNEEEEEDMPDEQAQPSDKN